MWEGGGSWDGGWVGHPIIIVALARNVSQRGESGASEGNCNRSSRGQGPSTMKAHYPKWEIDFKIKFCPEGDVYFDVERFYCGRLSVW